MSILLYVNLIQVYLFVFYTYIDVFWALCCVYSVGPASQSHVNQIHMHITRVGFETKTIAILEQMSFHLDRAYPIARDSSKPSFYQRVPQRYDKL